MTKKGKFFLISLFLLFPILSEAGAYIGQSGIGSVEGFVYDALTGSRLMGVRVESYRRSSLYTDHNGFFRIKELPVGVNHVVFRLSGYIPQEEVFVIYEDKKTYLAVFMWPVRKPPVHYLPPPPVIDPYHYRLSYPALDWWYGYLYVCPYHHYPSYRRWRKYYLWSYYHPYYCPYLGGR